MVALETATAITAEMATVEMDLQPLTPELLDGNIIVGLTVLQMTQTIVAWIALTQNQIIAAMQHSKESLEATKPAAEMPDKHSNLYRTET